VAGVALAYWLKDILWSSLPDASRLVVDLKIDLRVMGFTALVSLAAGVLFGIVPAFRGSRADIELALKSAGHKFTPVRSRAAKCLLAMQIAMSLVLVIGAGLFLQTLHNLKALAVGFNPENVLLFQISPRSLKYDNVRITALYEQMLEGIAAVPGVVGISRSSHELVSYFGEFGDIRIEGAKPGEFGWHDRPNMDMNGGFGGDSRMPAGQIREQTIHWNLFDTLGVRLLAGRGLRDSDDRSAPRVAVVNEAFATQFFPAQNPIGRRFEDGGPLVVEIVGIVTDIGLARGTKITPTPPTAYLSDRQKPPQGRTNVVVRTAVDPLTLVPAIRDAMRAVDPAVPLSQITTQVQQIESSFALQRALTVASNFFGVVALLLVSIGLYGVMSFSVVRRTNEIGVRMALGAQRIDIAWLVQREIVGVAFAGVALGLGVWFAKNNVITTALFGVPATDTLTLLSSALLMLILALIAGYLPSRRATRVDPIIALRHE
jgi:predicted permease